MDDCSTLTHSPETDILLSPGSEECDPVAFTAQGHSCKILSKIASLRSRDHQLCDVVLEIGDKKIYAHRVVLSACSNYFCAMFTNSMKESRQETIRLADLDEKAVEDLVEFTYTSKIEVFQENVQQLLKAACILQFSEVIGACCRFLEEQLHPSNCLGISSFAESHGCANLAASAQHFIEENFTEVVQLEEFLQVDFETISKLLSSEYINVRTEDEVFEAMHRWLTYGQANRKHLAYQLLSCIRLPLLRPVILVDHIYAKEVYSTNPQCVAAIMETMIYHTVREKRTQLKGKVKDYPRKGTMGTLLAIGGMDTCRNKGSIECFDPRKEIWKLVCHSHSTSRRLQFGVAAIDSKVYIVGGRNGLRTLNSVDCYNPKTNCWDAVSPMCSYRHGVGVGVMEGPMYAVGGHDGWSYLNSVERYDPVTRQWSPVSSMFSPRSTAGVAVSDGKLYVVGGRDSNSCLSTVECYNPHTDRWSLMPQLNVARGGVGVTMLDGRLYALGGHEISEPLKSVEVFDSKINEWMSLAPMNCARDAVAAVTFGGVVHAVGGFNGSMYLDSVEHYDPVEDVWRFSAKLQSGRAGAGVIVLPDLHVDTVKLEPLGEK